MWGCKECKMKSRLCSFDVNPAALTPTQRIFLFMIFFFLFLYLLFFFFFTDPTVSTSELSPAVQVAVALESAAAASPVSSLVPSVEASAVSIASGDLLKKNDQTCNCRPKYNSLRICIEL